MTLLNELSVFAAIARHGSLSAAGRALGLSKATVSDALRRLEERLDTRLLHRTTRRVSLTESGTACLAHAQRMVESARSATEAAQSLHGQPRGTLRVAAPTGLGQRRVVPALVALRREHPGLHVELSLSAAVSDLVAERFDVAVRIGELPDSRLVARRLGMQHLTLYAAPGYLAAHGAPRAIEDLAQHAVLEFQPLGWRGVWRLQGPGRRQCRLALQPCFATDCGEALLAAVVGGAGIAALPEWLAAADRDAGRLVGVLPGWQTRAVPIQAVHRHGGRLPAKTRVFLQHLAAQFAVRAPRT